MKYHYLKNKIPQWKTQKDDFTCTPKELMQANLRMLFDNEVVLDSESKEHAQSVYERLCKEQISFERYASGGRGEHLHMQFEGLEKASPERRKRFRELFIERYGCDPAKKSGWIAMEDRPHFKTGKMKTLIESKKFGTNKLTSGIVHFIWIKSA